MSSFLLKNQKIPFYDWEKEDERVVISSECTEHGGISVFIFKSKVYNLQDRYYYRRRELKIRRSKKLEQADHMWIVIVARDHDGEIAVNRFMGNKDCASQGVAKAFAYKHYRILNELCKKNREEYLKEEDFTDRLLREGSEIFGEQYHTWLTNKDYVPYYCSYIGYIEEYKNYFNPDCKVNLNLEEYE